MAWNLHVLHPVKEDSGGDAFTLLAGSTPTGSLNSVTLPRNTSGRGKRLPELVVDEVSGG